MAVRRSHGFSVVEKPVSIKAWSYSRWSEYEDCPRKTKYKHIDRLPDPGGPAMIRGSKIHDLCESYVQGTIVEIPAELETFSKEFNELKTLVDVKAEAEWAYTNTWQPTGWFAGDTWCRIKVDAVAFTSPKRTAGKVIDYKTGQIRKAHEKQTELYALGAFKMHPTLKSVTTELWYLDHGEAIDVEFAVKEAPGLEKKWNNRVKKMMSDTEFRPRPGNQCRWCPFSKAKNGPCEAG